MALSTFTLPSPLSPEHFVIPDYIRAEKAKSEHRMVLSRVDDDSWAVCAGGKGHSLDEKVWKEKGISQIWGTGGEESIGIDFCVSS